MDTYTSHLSKSKAETSKLGFSLAMDVLSGWNRMTNEHPSVYCLFGELGSGKTTFTQGFAKGIGVKGRIASPTFLISKRYSTESVGHYFYHLDLYRIHSSYDVQTIGIVDMLSDSDSCMVIEWADRMRDLLPDKRVDIFFSVRATGEHEISIHKKGFI